MPENMRILCQCGTVDFHASQPQPIEVYFCHCRQCQKQSSSAFGTSAIFPADGMWPPPDAIKSHLKVWTRPSKSGGMMHCYFCDTCGSRILHRTVMEDGSSQPTLSVKGGAVEGLDVTNARHIWTKSAIVNVPEGSDPGSPEA